MPSPSSGVWHLWVFPVRAYALCIIAGVIVSVVWADRRWVARGGRSGAIADMAMWAFPAGLIGARIYHLITDPELYFVHGRDPWDAFAIWHGGLGIWGGVAGGILGAWYAARRYGWRLSDLAWAVAPGLPVAQAIGRLGNWFNQELYGRPSTLPWALRIAPDHRRAATPLATILTRHQPAPGRFYRSAAAPTAAATDPAERPTDTEGPAAGSGAQAAAAPLSPTSSPPGRDRAPRP